MEYRIEKANADDYQAILRVMEPWNMHHVPSPEMESLNLNNFYVARIGEAVVGAGGYRILSPEHGKTTLLGIIPEFSGLGIGKALQVARLEAMYRAGVKRVTTNADRPDTILWYKKHFGYREVGSLTKVAPFSLVDVDHWTTLEMDLEHYMRMRDEHAARRRRYIEENDPAPLAPYPPLLINVCLTGMVPTRLSTPHVPITPEEIIEDAIRAFDSGARIVHLHARDEAGRPTPDVSRYERIISTLHRERPGIVCCATTSGRNWPDFESRAAVLDLEGDAKPDMASLTLGSLNFQSGPSVNSIEMIERLAMRMQERGIKPELEAFDLGMINLAKYLERNGILQGRKYFNLLLGNLNTAPATLGNLSNLTEALPGNSVWGATGIGQFQLPINVAALTAGGHVRVGIEDSIYYDYNKSTLATNQALVERVVRIADELQRPLASVRQTRSMLGLPPVARTV
ncbi:MAG: GNAT family N-acetyltransferase [Gammaproteobacteria bacterium]|nr:GNAT family N-acetyltransferase [Gammaproteobacteria bacterium]MCW8959626.1 GNAT family N-acetyltransferase [Gammaproteobacteria bacterium]MCW8972783.1 GNAT family N-acetyltransferase [Gammaproteobacteria bacterium]MCW8994100.1 GNAT family N-acetyltransferase [Gammaproteobacteria bacterium]